MKNHGFVGICLGGGKNQRTTMARLEYYPAHEKVFLSQIIERIHSEDDVSSDSFLLSTLGPMEEALESIAFDVPLSLPPCFDCQCKAKGFEKCSKQETQWMLRHYRRRKTEKKNLKSPLPYMERAIDNYLAHDLEEGFPIQPAMGANLAPLTARAIFLKAHLTSKCLEVSAPLAVFRLGSALKVSPRLLKSYRRSMDGESSRKQIVEHLMDSRSIFIYQQDIHRLTENLNAFEAFICAFTGYLCFKGYTQKSPNNFPKNAGWVEIPVEGIRPLLRLSR